MSWDVIRLELPINLYKTTSMCIIQRNKIVLDKTTKSKTMLSISQLDIRLNICIVYDNT